MSVSIEKPLRHLMILDRYHNYTLGGIAQYYAEITILSKNGYTFTEHAVTDRDDVAMTIAVLHFGDDVVKVYEL